MAVWFELGVAFVAVLVVMAAALSGHRPFAPQRCFEAGRERKPATVERAFVFADVVGFTALAETQGDREAARVAAALRWAARRSLRGDTVLVKALGDGVMLAAGDARAAAASALALLRHVDDDPHLPPVSGGVACGAAVAVDGDYFGRAVNLAARLAEMAQPGQVLCTDGVAVTCEGEPGTVPVGVATVKGLSDEVVLHELVDGARTGAGGE